MGVNNKMTASSGITTWMDDKYYDNYANGSTYNDIVAYVRRKLGDATSETRGWYSDYANFVYSSYPWALRGGGWGGGILAGVLGFGRSDGGDYSHFGARVVVQ